MYIDTIILQSESLIMNPLGTVRSVSNRDTSYKRTRFNANPMYVENSDHGVIS